MTVEGPGTVYMKRSHYMGYLNMALSSGEEDTQNILLCNLFIITSLLEITIETCVLSMFYISILLPMQLLAGKTHQLTDCNWSYISICKVYDTLETAFTEIIYEQELLINYN